MTAKSISSPQLTVYGKVSMSQEIGRLIAHKRKEIGLKHEVAAGLSGVRTKLLSQLHRTSPSVMRATIYPEPMLSFFRDICRIVSQRSAKGRGAFSL